VVKDSADKRKSPGLAARILDQNTNISTIKIKINCRERHTLLENNFPGQSH